MMDKKRIKTPCAMYGGHARDAREGMSPASDQDMEQQMNISNPSQPHDYARRILLAVTGLSPQVVTETLYALAVRCKPAFVPTEIHLITTAEGAERARLSLLHEKSGWYPRLCRDYGLKGINFDNTNLHVLKKNESELLADIRTIDDNESAADAITEIVRKLTGDPDSALHVSIAGGRKTMGFYVGYALSLYGRPQDRLSHVLVSASYESHPDFYYQTSDSHVIYTPGPDSKPLDTQDADVVLAEIPFVRLRHGLPDDLLTGRGMFSETVAAVQRKLGPPELVIDLTGWRIICGDAEVHLPPVDLAFYSWIAKRCFNKEGPIPRPTVQGFDKDYARAFLAEYRTIIGEMGDDEKVTEAMQYGMSLNYFDRRKSNIHKRLKKVLGGLAEDYKIHDFGKPRSKTYGLDLKPEQLTFGQASNE